jgi:hypothetical protein
MLKNKITKKQLIKLYYKNKKTQFKIAKIFGVSHQMISLLMKKYKLKIQYNRNGKNNPNWKGGDIKTICPICGKKFLAKRWIAKRNKKTCCNLKCKYVAVGIKNTGRKRSFETREKLSKSKIGDKNPNWNGGKIKKICKICGKKYISYPNCNKYCNRKCANIDAKNRKPWNVGISPSKKTREKLRKSLTGRKFSHETKIKLKESKLGSKNPNWKGGVSSEYLKLRATAPYRKWRESIYNRDNYTCQKCNDNSGGNLTPHHIKNYAEYPELRLDINNGITFCKKCHREFHKIYGLRHNTRKQLGGFLG